MRHVRMLTLCLVAAFAVGALAASSASASLPEWGKCVKLPATIKGKEKTKGKFGNANCTEPGSEYEFQKGTAELPSTEFTNTMTSEKAKLETSFGISVICNAETATGNLSGTKEVTNVLVTFKGCESNLLELACENQFESEGTVESFKYIPGEIRTRGLKGKLVYISGAGTASPVVGLQLEPTEKNGWFAFFGCGSGSKGEVPTPVIFSAVGRKPQGANGGNKVVSPITPLNTMGTETTQKYEIKKVENPETHELENERGVQEPSEINGKPAFLETQLWAVSEPQASEWGKAAQEEVAVTKLASGEELEIKA